MLQRRFTSRIAGLARLAGFVGLVGLALGCGSSSGTPAGASSSSGGPGGGDDGGAGGGGGDVDGGAGTPGDPVCPIDAQAAPGVVFSTKGALQGHAVPGGSSVAFLGVPYASPPVGALRFRAPEPHACWPGVRDAKAYGNECPQAGTGPSGVSGDEDCLTLNVWVPEDALPKSGEKASGAAALPVLFFIHGGAEIAGASNQPVGAGNLYDGRALAEREHVVVVSTNYRLGALGFLAHPALDAEDPHARSGNYAILDLVTALGWVQKNVASFGGDPARVMVFGESAGAANTCILTASPLAKGLFSSALMESGGCAAPPMATREQVGADVAKTLGCASGSAADVAACLRSKSPADVVNARSSLGDLASADLRSTWDMPYGANVDGYVLTEDPLSAFRAGRYNHVPFAIGSNKDEMELFVPQGSVNTCFDYETQVRKLTGSIADQVLALYPCSDYLLPRWAYVDVGTDAAFTCQARRVARALAGSPGAKPVYRYYYTHARDYGPAAAERSFHTAELPFVFRTWPNEGYVATPAETALSDAMQSYWAAFAKAGDPNGGLAPAWSAYDAAADDVITLDDTIGQTNGVKSAKCDFWDSVTQ